MLRYPLITTLDSLPPHIIIIIAASAVVLLALFIALYLLFIRKNSYKRKVNDLAGRYENMHSTLIGSDYQLIKKLELISGTNIMYANVLPKWRKNFDEIQGLIDADCIRYINEAKDLLADKKWKELKAILPDVKKAADRYEDELNKLDQGLKLVFKPETDANEKVHEIKAAFRAMKSDFYSKQNDLSLVNATFTSLFNKLENKLQNADREIANGHYDTALNILSDEVEPPLVEMTKDLIPLPKICVLIQTLIPKKLEQLSQKYNEMIAANYVLKHIMVADDILVIESQLSDISNKVKVLNLVGVQEEIDKISNTIDFLSARFEEEVEARHEFEKKKDEVFKIEAELQREQINLNHNMPDLKKIYSFTPDDQALISAITVHVAKCARLKREVETSINQTSLQPYSVVIKKVHELEEEIKASGQAIDNLKKHVASFKESAEKSYKAVAFYYAKARDYESKINSIGNDKVITGFDEAFKEIYETIDELSAKTKITPIDIRACATLTQSLEETANETFTLIDKLYEDKKEAEENILLANRVRSQSSVVRTILEQAENFFEEGSYEEAKAASSSAIEQARNNDLL